MSIKRINQFPSGSGNLTGDDLFLVMDDPAGSGNTVTISLNNLIEVIGSSAYHLSASTTNATPTVLSGDSLTLQNGEAWQFEVKVVAVNRKTSATKVWSIRGGIRRTFVGASALVGSLDTQTAGSIGGGSIAVEAGASGLVITATGLASTAVDWTATVLTSEETTTQQAFVGGCTDPDAENYSASADFNDGSCAYAAFPSSAALEPIASETEIESLEVAVGENVLFPAFDPAIKDYYVQTSAAYLGNVSYSVTINEDAPTEGTAKAGRTLQINDGTNYYYVRLLPSNVPVGTVEYGPTSQHEDGLYLTEVTVDGSLSARPYFCIFDRRGVPVWYGRGESMRSGLFLGNDLNEVIANAYNESSVGADSIAVRINAQSVSRTPISVLTSPIYGAMLRDSHDVIDVSLPASRRGNLLVVSYDDGFYIQEQSNGEIVWEWHSKEYFSSQDPEYYHLNSMDVHPVTGNIVVSLRNCSAVLCIEYATKNVLWVLQGVPSPDYGTLQSIALPATTGGVKWLSLSGEPEHEEFQYVGTRAQHDARWLPDSFASQAGRKVISVFDNQSQVGFGFSSSGAAPKARAVIFEIDEVAGTATTLSSIFSEFGTSQYIGSYGVIGTDASSLTHVVNFPQEHPCLREYVGPLAGAKTKVFEMDFPGDLYRIIKASPGRFRKDNLRATCGVDLLDGSLPAEGGGGSGPTLLMHFDGTNGSTTFTDSSPNARTVTATGNAAISTAQSKFGGASAYFDGNNSYLSVDSSGMDIGTGDFTVELWAYWLTVPSHADSLLNVNDYGGLSVYRDGGTYVVNKLVVSDRITNQFQADFLPNAEQWYHIAISRASGTMRVFIDGVLLGSAVSNSTNYANGTLQIGGSVDGSDWSLHGYIDEFRVVKGTAIYTDDFTPPAAPF